MPTTPLPSSSSSSQRSTADQAGLSSTQNETTTSSSSLDDDRPPYETRKDTSRLSGSASPELQSQPQSQSPHSSPSSPIQNRSPRQNGLEQSSSEEPVDTFNEGVGSRTGSNEEQSQTATTSATGAAAVKSSHSDADREVFSDKRLTHTCRVKLYELIEPRWMDRGTGLCTGIYDEEVDRAFIVARSEISDVELLRREIGLNDVYQRQQKTLILWTEPNGTDYALNFHNVDGCAVVWDFILEVQRHFRGKLTE